MWQIESLEIKGTGFLGGLDLQLPEGLTCIIGPRGSGKTTLAEALRFSLVPNVAEERAKAGLLKENLSGSMVVVRSSSHEGEAYTVSRSYPNAPVLATADGTPLDAVDLQRGTFLPFDAFTSREIEDIADESLGSKRRGLLDALHSNELREIELTLGEHKRALDANADRLQAAWRSIADKTEQIEQLATARAKLAALEPPPPGDATNQLALSTKQQGWTAQELERLRKLWADFEARRDSIAKIMEDVGELRVEAAEESANEALLRQISETVNTAKQDVQHSLLKAHDRIGILLSNITESGKALRGAHEEQSVEHQRLLEANAVLGQAMQTRAKAEQDVVKLELLERQRKEVEATLKTILNERRELKAMFVLERDKISDLREKAAETLGRDCGPNVRMRVMRNADDQAYQQALLKGLAGSRLRNHEELAEALKTLRPEQLSQILLDNDATELEHSLGLGAERTRRVLDALRESLNPLELEVLPTDDRVAIELNVGSEQEPNYKDASDLSRGQKCTALLPLLLARRDAPLLIDQPEDNLDNHFIFETVVHAIRRLKGRRQMIFITHNANIPVLADAELVVVMDSNGKRGFVKKTGNLDECRDEIIDLLEGGQEAFEKRRERYGLE